MRILSFTIYYLKLRIGAYLGTHHPVGPVNIKWRWETWHRVRKAERRYASTRPLSHLRDDLARLWKTIFS